MINIIAAMGKNREIGKDNKLLWHIKEDLLFFKKMTLNNTVIMGYNTFSGLEKCLENRQIIVLSKSKNEASKNAIFASSLAQAISLAKSDKIYITGGESVYKEALKLAQKIYLTVIDKKYLNADTYFVEFDENNYTKTLIYDSKNDKNSDFTSVNYQRFLYVKKV